MNLIDPLMPISPGFCPLSGLPQEASKPNVDYHGYSSRTVLREERFASTWLYHTPLSASHGEDNGFQERLE